MNAGGSLVFFVAGLGTLVLSHGSRTGRRLGAFAMLWGVSTALSNVIGFDEPARAVHFFVGMAATVALGLLIQHVAGPLRGTARRWFLAVVAGTGIGLAFFAFGTVQRLVDDRPFDQWSNFVASALFPATLVVLIAACVLRPARDRREGRAWLLLALSVGIDAALSTALSAARPTSLATHGVTALNISGLILGGVLCLVLSFVLIPARRDDPKASRFGFLALLAAGLVGCIMALATPAFGNYGSNGVARTLGAVLLIIALVKYDLLGVPLPRIVVRRSVLAGTALATLFIVAQIGQNFLSAQYGLVMGSIIAGAVLFAASPIQHAIERARNAGHPLPHALHPGKEDAYRNALRIALRDRVLTEDEEVHLAHLSDELGLTHRRAREIRNEVERERGAR